MTKGVKDTWVIQVCRTCGKLADWPFCVHRNQPPPPGGFAWCESITVTGMWHPARGADE